MEKQIVKEGEYIITKWNWISNIQRLVEIEIIRAITKFDSFNNPHEGYAVLLEEVEELWENVKLNQKNPDRLRLIKQEAIQVAAMAIRLIHDCCWEEVAA